MANLTLIPKGCSLRFVLSNSEIQNFENRLAQEESYFNYNYINIYQCYNIGDNILIQLITNQSTKNLTLINLIDETELDITNEVNNYSTAWQLIKFFGNTTEYGDVYVYEKIIYTDLLSGYFYLMLETDKEYYSEIFNIDEYDKYLKIAWAHSKIGICKENYWSGIEEFSFRLPGRLIEYIPAIELITNKSFNNNIENINGNAIFYANLEIDPQPRWVIEKLNWICQYDILRINDIDYAIEGGIEANIVKDNNLATNYYVAKLKLRKKDYAIDTILEIEETEETYYMMFNNSDYILINDTDIILWR